MIFMKDFQTASGKASSPPERTPSFEKVFPLTPLNPDPFKSGFNPDLKPKFFYVLYNDATE
jgi:hypothetical protein